eukprot:3560848-Amphidinium_carterae.1
MDSMCYNSPLRSNSLESRRGGIRARVQWGCLNPFANFEEALLLKAQVPQVSQECLDSTMENPIALILDRGYLVPRELNCTQAAEEDEAQWR